MVISQKKANKHKEKFVILLSDRDHSLKVRKQG